MKVIFTCFAGRERYLRILIPYINELVTRNLVDAVHIWDYTRNIEDGEFLKKYCNHFEILTPNIKENYGDYYKYYRSSRFPDPETVLIKCDDDIVYIDIDNFNNFVEARCKNKDALIFSPSVINNPICGIIQNVYNIFPKARMAVANMSAETAKKVHAYFLDNRAILIENSMKSQEVHILPNKMKTRFNINFIAILGRDFDELFDSEYITQDDECYLGVYAPCYYKRNIHIYNRLVVSHMAYTSQRKEGFDETIFMDKYLELSQTLFPQNSLI